MEINVIFLIRPSLYMNKKAKTKTYILKTKRAFEVKYKAFFIIFKGLSVPKNYLRPESAPLRTPFFTEHLWWLLLFFTVNPLSANPTKWSNILKQFVGSLLTNYLTLFDHFAGLALKGLTHFRSVFRDFKKPIIWLTLQVK